MIIDGFKMKSKSLELAESLERTYMTIHGICNWDIHESESIFFECARVRRDIDVDNYFELMNDIQKEMESIYVPLQDICSKLSNL